MVWQRSDRTKSRSPGCAIKRYRQFRSLERGRDLNSGDNLASLDLELSAEQLKSLDGASRIDLGFPQSIYERETVRAVRYGGIWDSLLLECSIPLLASGNIKLQSPLYWHGEKVRPYIDICHLSC